MSKVLCKIVADIIERAAEAMWAMDRENVEHGKPFGGDGKLDPSYMILAFPAPGFSLARKIGEEIVLIAHKVILDEIEDYAVADLREFFAGKIIAEVGGCNG